MPEEKKTELEEEVPGVEEDGRVKLSDVLSAILDFNANPHDEGKYDRVQDLINSIDVRERLTLMEKDVALVGILSRIPEEGKDDAATAAVALELAKYFEGLFKYAVNLNIDINYTMLDIAVYDALEAFGFGDRLLRFCEKDFAKLCGMVDNALDFRNIDKIVRISALFSDENMKEFKETVAALKYELTPERLAQMKAVVAAGDPAWEALRSTVAETAVENAMLKEVVDLAPEKSGKVSDMDETQSGKTYFAVSDIHSFYVPLKEALDEAGFKRNDPNHVLIVCGDIFDRGYETNEVLRFLKSLPKERRVLIRGNHERLLRDCYERGYYYDYDESNGTIITMCQLAGKDPNWRQAYLASHDLFDRSEYNALWQENYEKPFKSRRIANVIAWMWSDEWVDYYELGDFVFVHSWVPTKQGAFDDRNCRFLEVANPNWRNLDELAWDAASWGCPWKKFLDGALPEGKTIVCGHWHVQDFHTHLEHDVDGYKNRDIYFGDRLIALDAATALPPHVCNVLVIKDGRCYDKHRKALN